MFKINIFLTFSKIMSIIILILGTIFSFIYKNPEVIIFTLSLSSGLAGLKTWSEGLTKRKEINNITNPIIKPREEIG